MRRAFVAMFAAWSSLGLIAARAEDPPSTAITARGPTLAATLSEAVADARRGEKTKGNAVLFVVDCTSALSASGAARVMLEVLPGELAQANRAQAEQHFGVVALGDQPRLLLPPGDDPGRLAAALERLEAMADGSFKNVCEALRMCVSVLEKFSGARSIVLYCPENGDAEDHLEETGALLKRARISLIAISRDAVYSDPYWEKQARPAGLPSHLHLMGGEQAEPEAPSGWLLQRYVPHETVASGFGLYGLSRLCAITGGRYHVFASDSGTPRGFCQTRGCLFCGGTHQRCDTLYPDYVIETHGYPLGSRNDYARMILKDPLAKVWRAVWQQAFDAGLCQSAPAELGTQTRAPTGPSGRASLSFHSSFSMGGSWDQYQREAAQARAAARSLLSTLDGALKKMADKSPPRIVAAVELFAFQLHVLDFNLGEALALCDLVQRGKAQGSRGPFLPNANAETQYFQSYEVCFCHGTRRLERLDWLAGGDAATRLVDLKARYERLMTRYERSPWGLQARRTGLVYFREVQVSTGATAVVRPRPKASTKTPTPQTTAEPSSTPQRAAQPARPSGGGAAGGGVTTPGGK